MYWVRCADTDAADVTRFCISFFWHYKLRNYENKVAKATLVKRPLQSSAHKAKGELRIQTILLKSCYLIFYNVRLFCPSFVLCAFVLNNAPVTYHTTVTPAYDDWWIAWCTIRSSTAT